MSWMQRLYETYNCVAGDQELSKSLEPFYHKKEKCHVKIIIDQNGNFRGACSLLISSCYKGKEQWKAESVIIPITPKSLTGRTSGAAPYPFAERIQYIAKDYKKFGGTKKGYFNEYFKLLDEWSTSPYRTEKIIAVKKYVEKGTIIRDLVSSNLLFIFDKNGDKKLISDWNKQATLSHYTKKPPLFLLNDMKTNGRIDQGNVMVCWVVEIDNDPQSSTWDDCKIIQSWQDFQSEKNSLAGVKRNFCQVSGKKEAIAKTHPKGIFPKANKAKLISTPSNRYYLTYQGRFTNENQPCQISFEFSQKAHNALKWLINRQGYFPSENSAIVAWAISGKNIPELFADTYSPIGDADEEATNQNSESEGSSSLDHSIDIGQSFAGKLNKKMAGYHAELGDSEKITIMAIDSATQGRMGITYYREFHSKEFIDRVESWHLDFAWEQKIAKKLSGSENKKRKTAPCFFIGVPSPDLIAKVAYGEKPVDSLKKNLYERLLPCMVEGHPLPIDILNSCVRRASNPNGSENWERNLGVACALYRGFYIRHPIKAKQRSYHMSLEVSNNSRDYLYGRLLAIAQKIEATALRLTGEKRMTMAERLMQRFSERPCSTWRTIELALKPYMQRLKYSRAKFLKNRQKEMDEIINAFERSDFIDDKKLSGEFLLGYHCQRQKLRNNSGETKNSGKTEILTT